MARSHPQPKSAPVTGREKPLLATTTGEPFQPVRLYYAVRNAEEIRARLLKLDCIDEGASPEVLEWLYEGQAAKLTFPSGGNYARVPAHIQPIVLGRIRFPRRTAMTLQVNSTDRAIVGAQFLGPILGEAAVALRVRVINRFFSPTEGTLAELGARLDQDVVVVDPRESEHLLRWAAEGLSGKAGLEAVLEACMDKMGDLPLVEDLQLVPEEETPAFRDLDSLLRLRQVHAMEHWKGNEEVTFASMIMRAAKTGPRPIRRKRPGAGSR